MADKTGISWTHRPGTVARTWNCVRGCSRKSTGCTNCYAEVQAARIVRMGKGKPTKYDGLVKLVGGKPRWTGEVRLDANDLAEPLRWRQPSTVFVNSMSDLFHESLTNEQIAAVFGVMAAAPQHTFQVLTKRAKRMREWFEWAAHPMLVGPTRRAEVLASYAIDGGVKIDHGKLHDKIDGLWPLPNVWLGVSVENQEAADERIPELLRTPAAVRFLSCEPLIGPVDLTRWLNPKCIECGETNEPWRRDRTCENCGETWPGGLSWIIAGCESGPGARDCDPAWLRSLMEQCEAAGIARFLKQAKPWDEGHHTIVARGVGFGPGSKRKPGGVIELPYLDGTQHKEFPRHG